VTALVDRESPVPAFMQIEQDIRRQILSGVLREGSRLARETVLAERYGASRVTVRRALEELAKHNLIKRMHGVGTIVTPPAAPVSCDLDLLVSCTEQLRRAGYDPEVELDRQLIVDTRPAEFDRVKRVDGPFIFLRRVIKVEGHPVVINHSWLPASRFAGLEERELVEGSLWKTITRYFAVEPEHSDNRIEVVKASSEEARLLRCDEASPLLRSQGVVYDADGEIVEFCIALWGSNTRLNFSSR